MSGACPKCGLQWLNGSGDRLCIECAGGAYAVAPDGAAPAPSPLPTVGSKWWSRVGSSFEGPWIVQEVSHAVTLYLPNELSPCGAFWYIPLANWPAGLIGAVS